MHKHILLLAADTSDNCMGRVWILADMLARGARPEIMGLRRGAALWPPLAGDETHPIREIKSPLPDLLGTLRLAWAVYRHPAEVIYVCKPRWPNMLAALLGARGRRLVLDIDDWEAGCARGGFSQSRIINALAARGISFTQLADLLIPLIKRRTVCNVFFQKRYGGALVPHARDEKRFEAMADTAAARKAFGLPQDAKLVMFFGTPHAHKGVQPLIEAMNKIKHEKLELVLAGGDINDPHVRELKSIMERMLPGRFHLLSFVPWRDAPKLLACPDVLVVPQTQTRFTQWGQTPAKIFDALAAGRPLIASDIADIAQLVDGCAQLVAPGDVMALAAALDAIFDDETAAKARAEKGRSRFFEQYSYAVVAPRLLEAAL